MYKITKMKIEEEIKQTKFRDIYEKAVLNLFVTTNGIEALVNRLMKGYGITMQQFNVLRILKGQYPNPAPLNLISCRMLDKMSNASRIIDKLVAKELITRNTCPNDRRAVDHLITQKGMELLVKVNESLYELYDKKFKNLNKTETEQLNKLLQGETKR
mgnify:CR=1 FL=1